MLDIAERIDFDEQVIISMSYLYQWVALAIVDGRPWDPRNMTLQCSTAVPNAEHGSAMFRGTRVPIAEHNSQVRNMVLRCSTGHKHHSF